MKTIEQIHDKAAGSVDLDEGKTYTGKATIKKHNEYKGIKLTVISRFKPKEEK
jgi:hypothetical protein